jgi:hypothetical protein
MTNYSNLLELVKSTAVDDDRKCELVAGHPITKRRVQMADQAKRDLKMDWN